LIMAAVGHPPCRKNIGIKIRFTKIPAIDNRIVR
jgi:hypothetical protein